MQHYSFDTPVNRAGADSLKELMTPKPVLEAGLPSYWGAEFDFPTCPAFSEGVMECARRGLYAFTPQSDAYNARVAWWLKNVRDWEINGDWIVPTHGTIFALATAIRLFVGEGQNLVVITPGYSRYKQAADRMGRGTVFSPMRYDRESGVYAVDFEDLERRLADPANALLAFSNPNNPTGLALDAEALRRIDALSRKYGVPVFCDEIFAEITLTGDVIVPYGSVAAADSLTITCTSLGKCMSLTGVNHANVLIPNAELREKYVRQKYADHYGSIDPLLYAGLMRACTAEGRAWLDALLEVVRANRRAFQQGIEALLPGAKVVPAQGAFLAWVDYTGLGLTDGALKALLDRALLTGDPGSEYGATDQFYRYSIAVPPAMLQKSMEYLRKTLEK